MIEQLRAAGISLHWLLERVAQHTHDVVLVTQGANNHCVLASGVALTALKAIDCDDVEVIPVECLSANVTAMKAYEAGIEKWSYEPGAYALYTGPDMPVAEGLWAGHLVLRVHHKLIDPTADQHSRTEFGMEFRPLVLDLTETFFAGKEYQIHQPGGPGTCGIGYRPTPQNVAYQNGNAWTDKARHESLAAIVIQRVVKDIQALKTSGRSQ